MRRFTLFIMIALLLAVPVIAQEEVDSVLFDLALGHNMLFNKVMDLSHIIQTTLFQLEMKTVEIQLTNNPCSSQPVSFWMPSDISPLGKLNEIDSMIELLIFSLDKGLLINPTAFGIIPPDTAAASSLLSDAETCISAGQFREAFECKCLAYRTELLGKTDTSVDCDPIGVC